MEIDLGKQYHLDDPFKAKARLHQSRFRRDTLKVACDVYGSNLQEADAMALLNYYPHLGVREALRRRYPDYSQIRDANLLRSEHIPFNMFAPLVSRHELAKSILNQAFLGDIREIIRIEIEYAPEPKKLYLNDGTSFDTYVEYRDHQGCLCAYGIEVKYTEHEYKIHPREKARIQDKESEYWAVTRKSHLFREDGMDQLGTDKMRQIWRNHLLGLSMVQKGVLDKFRSVTVYPSGNDHFREELPLYQALLKDPSGNDLIPCTFERFFAAIEGDDEILQWKAYLTKRYLCDE